MAGLGSWPGPSVCLDGDSAGPSKPSVRWAGPSKPSVRSVPAQAHLTLVTLGG